MPDGTTETVTVEQREVPLLASVDVAVVGAGAAGVAAAVAAAGEGAETLLLDRVGYFGGTSTGGGIATFCGFFSTATDGDPEKIVAGVGDRVLDGLRERSALEGPVELRDRTNIYVYDPEVLKLVYDDLVAAAGVEALLDVHVSDARTVQGEETGRPAVRELIVETPAGTRAVRARRVVDASGDGFVAHAAGAAVNHDPDAVQSSTVAFFLSNVDEERVRAVEMSDVRDAMRAAVDRGDYALPKTDGIFLALAGRDKVWCNVTDVVVDPTDPAERTRGLVDGRAQAEEYLRFFRAEVDGFETAVLDHFAAMLGVRETRKVVGDYVLDLDDFRSARRFDDAIAHCGWPRERHDPAERASEWDWLPQGGWYDVPYRALLARDLSNVLVAGRCVSATPEVQASVRVIGTAFATGEAAGTAAATSAASDRPLRAVPVDRLRTRLRERGAFLD